MLSGRMSGRSGPGRRVSSTSGLSLVNKDLNCSLRMRALEGASENSCPRSLSGDSPWLSCC